MSFHSPVRSQLGTSKYHRSQIKWIADLPLTIVSLRLNPNCIASHGYRRIVKELEALPKQQCSLNIAYKPSNTWLASLAKTLKSALAANNIGQKHTAKMLNVLSLPVHLPTQPQAYYSLIVLYALLSANYRATDTPNMVDYCLLL